MSVAIVDGIYTYSYRKEIKTDTLFWSVQHGCFLFIHAIGDGFYSAQCKPPVEVLELSLMKGGGEILVKTKADADVLAAWYEKQLAEVQNSYKNMR